MLHKILSNMSKMKLYTKTLLICIITQILSTEQFEEKQSYINYHINLFNLITSSNYDTAEYKQSNFSILGEKKDSELEFLLNSEIVKNHQQSKKDWTILIYIAGDNDLFKYAIRNIYQMMNIGSSHYVNLLIHFDFHAKGKKKMTRRYYIMKDKLLQIGEISPCDSGDPRNLINAAAWAIKNYPSNYFGIILWDHGTGSVDPNLHTLKNMARPELFFEYDPYNKKIVLKENTNFLAEINNNENSEEQNNGRGICFDDTSKNYLNNKKLQHAFEKIAEILVKKKIDIVLFDACLMMGIEVAHLCAPYIDYLVGSEEVVLGPGYNYGLLFQPLLKNSIQPRDYAKYVVKSYAQTYAPIARDFTQSALCLGYVNDLTAEFTTLVDYLIGYLDSEEKDFVKKMIKFASARDTVTHFAEPSYIDFKHFLENILVFLSQASKNLKKSPLENQIIKIISEHITQKIYPLIEKIVIANVNGAQNNKAYGLYIYFPHNKSPIENGYFNTDFPALTHWTTLLKIIKI
jgi:hypothetical protein